jgi:Skp family chaperone for outer membrane proteins
MEAERMLAMIEKYQKEKWFTPALILGLVLLIIIGTTFCVNLFSFKIGLVDMDKIMTDSETGKDFRKDLESKYMELRAKQALAKSEDEKKLISQEFTRYESEKKKTFFEDFVKSAEKVGKWRGAKAIMMKNSSGIIYSSLDLTDAIIKELDK